MTASLDMEAFEAAIGPKTKMVAVTHMSNVLGTVNPIARIIEIAHARGVPVLIDGSQGAVHETVDVQALGADFYVFTGHKLYGPNRHRRALRQVRSARRPCSPIRAAAR